MDNRQSSLWIATLILLLTVIFMDAGALAWSAAFISGTQLVAEVLTFFVLVSGVIFSLWKMTSN